jgi:hypothetical protein
MAAIAAEGAAPYEGRSYEPVPEHERRTAKKGWDEIAAAAS